MLFNLELLKTQYTYLIKKIESLTKKKKNFCVTIYFSNIQTVIIHFFISEKMIKNFFVSIYFIKKNTNWVIFVT